MVLLPSSQKVLNEMLSLEWRITYTCITTLITNLPFGYIRGGFRKLSFWRFAAIHAPVPLLILVRKFHKLELTWELAPFLIGSFIIGQFIGRKIYNKKHTNKKNEAITS